MVPESAQECLGVNPRFCRVQIETMFAKGTRFNNEEGSKRAKGKTHEKEKVTIPALTRLVLFHVHGVLQGGNTV